MAETPRDHTHHTRFRIPLTMWQAYGRVTKQLGTTRTADLLNHIRHQIREHGTTEDLTALEAAEKELTQRRSRKGGRPPKPKREE